MKKRYSYRAYPTAGQRQSAAQLFGCVRVVFNDFIAERERAFRSGEDFAGSAMLSKQLISDAKKTPEREWLAEVSAVPLQQSLRDANTAYRNFFNSISGKRGGPRVGKPRFKKRSGRQKARFTRNAGFQVQATTHGVGFVRLPKIGRIRFVLSRELPSEPSSVTLMLEPDGTYWVSFVVDVPDPAAKTETISRAAGIDLGLTDFAAITYSDGTREKITNPRHLRTAEKKLARAQRALSRKKKGSANRAKARIKVARLHTRVRNTRADQHRKLAHRLTHENQVVAVEGLNIRSLARSGATGRRGRGLRKSIHDAGWGTFLQFLDEAAQTAGTHLVVIDQWEPTSQVCAVCGIKDGPKPLGIRVWGCVHCGAFLDRDYNAALNILTVAATTTEDPAVAAGLAETLNACGGDVRRQLAGADPGEAGTHRTTLVAA